MQPFMNDYGETSVTFTTDKSIQLDSNFSERWQSTAASRQARHSLSLTNLPQMRTPAIDASSQNSPFCVFIMLAMFVGLVSCISSVSAAPYIFTPDTAHYAALSSPNTNNAAALYLRFRKATLSDNQQDYVQPFMRFRKSYDTPSTNAAPGYNNFDVDWSSIY